MAPHPPPPMPNWNQIASFYAGRPVTIGTDSRGPLEATTGLPESGRILLGSAHRQNLDSFAKQWAAAKTERQKAGLANLAATIIPVLIHEAMHNRHYDRSSGFKDAGNENQAIALGTELMPDVMQRFFGVKLNSRLSKAMLKAAKGRAEYQNVYDNPYFPPPTRNL